MAPHILVLPFPAQGHLPPIILLARKLVDLGCHVTLANISPVHELLLELEELRDHGIKMEPLEFDYPTPAGVVAAYNQDPTGFMSALHDLKHPLDQLIQRQQQKVSCVVADHFMGEMSWPVSHRHGIPFATYWSGNASWLLFDYHVPKLLAGGHIPLTGTSRSLLLSVSGAVTLFMRCAEAQFLDDIRLVHVPGLGPLKPSEAPSHAYEAYLSDKKAQLLFMSGFERISKSSWVLSNTFHDLESASIDAAKKLVNPGFLPVGPLVDDGCYRIELSPTPQDSKCLPWLDDRDPCSVLYVAFGTIASLSCLQLQEIAKGLEASEVPFIWVLRSEEAAKLPTSLVERMSNRSMVVSWAPQKQILEHPSLCGFLTHCGWNSVLEGLLAGVPMLAWPCIYEQPINRKLLVHEWKAGLGFAADTSGLVPAGEVEQVVRAFMGDQHVRSRAQQLEVRGRQSCDIGGASSANLVSFVQSIQDAVVQLYLEVGECPWKQSWRK